MLKSSRILGLLLTSAMMVMGVGAAQVATSSAAWADDDRGRGDGLDLYLTRTLDPTAIKPITNDMYTGNGNTVVNFMLKRNLKQDLEIAVKAKFRQGPDIRPTYVDADGIVHVEVPTGAQLTGPTCSLPSPPTACNRAIWSWDYSISSAIEGSTRPLLDFDCRMRIDLDQSKKAKYLNLKLVRLRPPGPFGSETDANGLGWKAGSTTVIPDDAGNPDDAGAPEVQVTQNSQNYAFYRSPPFPPYNFGPAEFDFEISCAKKGGDDHDHDDDDRGGSTTVHVVFNVVPVPTP